MDLSKLNQKTWLIGALRRLSSRWPPRYITKTEARVARGKYRCNNCKGEDFGPKEIQIDHIVPVGSFDDWNTFINNLFCPKENLQALCLTCHEAKSTKEGVVRRKKKAKQKIDK